MNRIYSFFDRERGLPYDQSYDFALERLSVAQEDSWRGIQPSQYGSDYNPEPPIFAAKFANCDGYRHILAIANEDGKIALQDTTKRNTEPEDQFLTAPQCHLNAVFDLEWAPNRMRFVSASGDHTAQLWEVTNSQLVKISHYMGHTRSVKTATFRKNDASVFATGGRDGAIIIWDTRSKLNVDMTPRADNCILSGHTGGPGTPVSQKKRTRTPKLNTTGTSSSITGLAFQDENTLISCGAGDGIIKVWDLRRNYSTYKKEPLPKHSLPYAGSSTFKGFTNLIVNAAGTHLYANCMDNTIYCYNLCSYSSKPLARYKGLFNSTFYIKSCLSPDNKYLLSGSSDENAYIWNLKYPDEPLLALVGHDVEVTCVAWGKTHDRPIVTCSDDARHKIWRIGSAKLTEKSRGYAKYMRKNELKTHIASTHKYNLRELESTPRSLKRLVQQNERTPSTTEQQVSNKRSFLEMLVSSCHIDSANDDQQSEQKRAKTLESRGRRLFSPSNGSNANASCSSSSVSPTVRCLNVHFQTIPEEPSHQPSTSSNLCSSPVSRHQTSVSNQENTLDTQNLQTMVNKMHSTTTTPSPLSEREDNRNHQNCTSPLQTTGVAVGATNAAYTHHSNTNAATTITTIFSPTSNLPNYVIDGDAPHLGIMSPKRKHKGKVDWLTNLRKQKLMSSCRSVETTFSEKLNETAAPPQHVAHSPRLQHLRESSPRLHTTPRRRISHAERHHENILSPSSRMPHSTLTHPKTPTSSRRNSETSILRFFTIQSSSSNVSRHDSDDSNLSAHSIVQSSTTSSSSHQLHTEHGNIATTTARTQPTATVMD